MLRDIPVPSQVILTSTIEKSKSALFTVCNKLLIQLCSKIGGEPWAINELPFFYDCTMVAGYYVTDKVLSYTASLNAKATRYWSKCLNISSNEKERHTQLNLKLSSLFFESLLAFKLRMNCCPKQIFFFTNKRMFMKDNLQSEIDTI